VTGTITFRRKATDRVMKGLFYLCAFLVVLPLFLILFDLVIKGAKELGGPCWSTFPARSGNPGAASRTGSWAPSPSPSSR